MLHCVAECCTVLQCFAVCCSELHRVSACCSAISHVQRVTRESRRKWKKQAENAKE